MHTLTGRQFRLNTARTQPRRALRWAAHRAPAPLPPVQSWLASQYSGLAVRYPAGPGEHPLTGRRLPRGQVMLGNGSVCRLYELFRQGRFVLLADGTGGGNGAGGLALPDAPGLAERVTVVRYWRHVGAHLPAAALVRPDGYVAWASSERDPGRREQAACPAVRHWCVPG